MADDNIPVKMLVDQDWLTRHVEADPDCDVEAAPRPEEARCHADRDGECTWAACPQVREHEPETTGRHCPLDNHDDEEF